MMIFHGRIIPEHQNKQAGLGTKDPLKRLRNSSTFWMASSVPGWKLFWRIASLSSLVFQTLRNFYTSIETGKKGNIYSWWTVGNSSKASLLASLFPIVPCLEEEHIFYITKPPKPVSLIFSFMQLAAIVNQSCRFRHPVSAALISPLGSNAFWVLPESETTCNTGEAWKNWDVFWCF